MDYSKQIQQAEEKYNKLLEYISKLLKGTYESLVASGEIEFPIEPQHNNLFIASLMKVLNARANYATRLYARSDELEILAHKTQSILQSTSPSEINNFILTQIKIVQEKYPLFFGDIKKKKRSKKIDKLPIPDAFKYKLKQNIVPKVMNKIMDIINTKYSEDEKIALIERVFTDQQYGTFDNEEMLAYLYKLKLNAYINQNIPFPDYLEQLLYDSLDQTMGIQRQPQAPPQAHPQAPPQESAISQTAQPQQTSNVIISESVYNILEELISQRRGTGTMGNIIMEALPYATEDNPDIDPLEIQQALERVFHDIVNKTSGAGRNHKSKNNKWISHVKKIQNQHKCTYSQALKLASKTYKK
jgi:hypothetical protein